MKTGNLLFYYLLQANGISQFLSYMCAKMLAVRSDELRCIRAVIPSPSLRFPSGVVVM